MKMPQFSDVIDKATVSGIVERIRKLGTVGTGDEVPGLDAVLELTTLCKNIHKVAEARRSSHGLGFFSATGDRGLSSFLGRVLPHVIHTLFRRTLTDTRSGAAKIVGPLNDLFQATLQLAIDFMPYDIVELQRVCLLLLNGPAAAPGTSTSAAAAAQSTTAAATTGTVTVTPEEPEFSIKSVLNLSHADTRNSSFYRNYGVPEEITLNKVKVVSWPDEQDAVVTRAKKLIGRRVLIDQGKEAVVGEIVEYDHAKKQFKLEVPGSEESKTADMWSNLNAENTTVLPPAPRFEDPEKPMDLPTGPQQIGTFIQMKSNEVESVASAVKEESSNDDAKPQQEQEEEQQGDKESENVVGELVAVRKDKTFVVQFVDLKTGELTKKVNFETLPPSSKVVLKSANPDEDQEVAAAAAASLSGTTSTRISVARGTRLLPATTKDTTSMYLYENVLFFTKQGGFDAIHTRMRVGCGPNGEEATENVKVVRKSSKRRSSDRKSKLQSKPSVVVGEPDKKVHLGLVMVFGLIHKFGLRHLEPSLNKSSEIKSNFTDDVFARCLCMSQNEMRDVPTREVDLLLVLAVQLTDDENRMEMITKSGQFKMNLMLMYMRCTKLERRLFGIKKLLEAVETCETKGTEVARRGITHSVVHASNFSVLDLPVDAKWLSEWLTTENVIGELFGSDMHLELIRRGEPVIYFLAKRKQLTEGDVSAIWKGCLGKHEAVVAVLHAVVEKLVTLLPSKLRTHLYSLIAKTPFKEFDDRGDTLALVFNFTCKAIEADAKDAKENKSSQKKSTTSNQDLSKFYGLDVLWQFIQDDSTRMVSADQLNVALEYLVKLLSEASLCMSHRWQMIEQCVKNLKNTKSVPQSLILLRRIINSFPQASKTWYSRDNFRSEPKNQWSIIETLEQKFEITKDLFNDIVFYHSCLQSAKTDGTADGTWEKNGASLNEFRPAGSCYNHLEQLQHRLDFIMFVVTSSSLRVAQGSVQTIWETLVRDAHTPESRDLVLQWFGKALEPSLVHSTTTQPSSPSGAHEQPASPTGKKAEEGTTHSSKSFSVFSHDVMRYVFTKQMPKLKVANMSHTAVQIYLQYFVVMNLRAKLIRINPPKDKPVSPLSSGAAVFRRNTKGGGKLSIAAGAAAGDSLVGNSSSGKMMSTGSSLDDNSPIGDRSMWPTPEQIERTGVSLLGREYLTQIALESKDDKVGRAAIKVLCTVHSAIAGKAKQKTSKIQREFFDLCLAKVSVGVSTNGVKSQLQARRAATLLKSFLSHYSDTESTEVRIVVLPPGNGYPGSLLRREALPVTSATGATLVKSTTSTTLNELRIKIAKELGYIHDPSFLRVRLVHTPALYAISERNITAKVKQESAGKRVSKRRLSAMAIGKSMDVAAADAAGLLDFAETTGRLLEKNEDHMKLSDLGITEFATLEAIDTKPVSQTENMFDEDSDSDILTPVPFSNLLNGPNPGEILNTNDKLEVGYDDALATFGSKPLTAIAATAAATSVKEDTVKAVEVETTSAKENDSDSKQVENNNRTSLAPRLRRPTRITIVGGGKPPELLRHIPYEPYMQDVFNQMFSLLDGGSLDKSTSQQLWQCTLLMPPEAKVQKAFKLLEPEPTNPKKSPKGASMKSLSMSQQAKKVNWKLIFPSDKTHKLAYGLRSLYSYLALGAARKVRGLNLWCLSFIKTGGFAHLVSIVKDYKALSGPRMGTALAYLYHIVWNFANSDDAVRSMITGASESKTNSTSNVQSAKSSRLSLMSGFRSPTSGQTMRRLSLLLSGSKSTDSSNSATTTTPKYQKSTTAPKLQVAGVVDHDATKQSTKSNSKQYSDLPDTPSPVRNIQLPIESGSIPSDVFESLVTPVLEALMKTMQEPEHVKGHSGTTSFPTSGSKANAGALLSPIPNHLLVRLSLRLAIDSALIGGTSAATSFVNHKGIGNFLEFFLFKVHESKAREEATVALVLLAREVLKQGRSQGHLNEARSIIVTFFGQVLKMFDVLESASAGKSSKWHRGHGPRNRKKLMRSCEQYFALLSNLILLLGADEKQSIGSVELVSLFERFANALQQHNAVETSMSTAKDHLLIGIVQTMRSVLRTLPSLASTPRPDLVKLLYCEYLFPTTSDSPKAVISESRSIVYALVIELCEEQPDNLQELLNLLESASLGTFEADNSELLEEWRYSPQAELKHPNQYVGLRNLGATCYMNSLMQQVYMTPQFKDPFMQLKDDLPPDSLLYQAQAMFGALRVGNKHFYDTRAFAGVLKDLDGSPIRVSEQRDVDEFAGIFFDHLEKESKGAKKLIGNTFGGTLVQQIVSKDPANPYVSERTEPFYALQLEVKNKKDIRESLDAFVQGDLLAGDAQYSLPSGDKVDATKRYVIKDLPPHLFVILKRFEFNYETMNKQKLNDRCAFPLELDMEPYTYEHITSRDGSAQGPVERREKSHYEYELSGILAHSGTVDSGHYYSFVRERVPRVAEVGRQWFEFNDKSVWPYPVDRIPRDCFGGVDYVEKGVEGGRAVHVAIPKHYNAYMLVYDRKSVVQELNQAVLMNEPLAVLPNQEEGSNEDSSSGDLLEDFLNGKASQRNNPNGKHGRKYSMDTGPLPTRVVELVSKENAEFMYNKNVFDPSCFKFMWNVLHIASAGGVPQSGQKSEGVSPRTRFQAIKLVTKYFIYVVCHSATTDANLNKWFTKVRQLFQEDKIACAWFLDTAIGTGGGASSKGVAYGTDDAEPQSADPTLKALREEKTWMKLLLQDCPLAHIRKLFGDLILGCIKSLKTSDANELFETRTPLKGEVIPTYYNDAVPLSLVARTLDTLVTMVDRAGDSVLTCPEFFQLLLDIASLGSAERKFFMKHDLIYPLVEFYSTDHRAYTMNGKAKLVIAAELPNMSALPTLVVLLARTCKTGMKNTSPKGPPKTAMDGQPHELSARSFKTLLENYSWLDELVANEPELAVQLLTHFSWECENDNKYIFQFVMDNFKKCADSFAVDKLVGYLKVMKGLLLIGDTNSSARVQSCIPVMISKITQILRTKDQEDEKIVYHATKMLLECSAQNNAIRATVMNYKPEWQHWPKLSGKAWASQSLARTPRYSTVSSITGTNM